MGDDHNLLYPQVVIFTNINHYYEIKQNTSVPFRNDHVSFFLSDVPDDSGLDSQPRGARTAFPPSGQPALGGESQGPDPASHPHVHRGCDRANCDVHSEQCPSQK